MTRLGDRIRVIREDRHIKQATLARRLGIPSQTLSNYEIGPNKVPADLMPKLAAALGVTVSELYGVEESHLDTGTGAGKTEQALLATLRRALELGPERI